jgi:hypothetical protein
VSGDLRTFAGVAWSLEQRLVRATQGGGALVDLFFHVWSSGTPLDVAGEAELRALARRHVDGGGDGDSAVVARVVVEDTAARPALVAEFYGESGLSDPRQMARASSRASFFSQWRKANPRRLPPPHPFRPLRLLPPRRY